MGRKNKTAADDYNYYSNDDFSEEENIDVDEKLNGREYDMIAMTIFHNLQDRIEDMAIEVMTKASFTDFIDFIKQYDTQNYNFNDEMD